MHPGAQPPPAAFAPLLQSDALIPPPEALAEIRSWPELHAIWWMRRTGQPTPGIAAVLKREPVGQRPKRAAVEFEAGRVTVESLKGAECLIRAT